MNKPRILPTQEKSHSLNSLAQSRTRTYQLLINQPYHSKESEHQNKSGNIFKEHLPRYIGEEREIRPVGGENLLKKMDLIQEIKQRKLSKGKIKLLEAVKDLTFKRKEKSHRSKTEFPQTHHEKHHRHIHRLSSIDPHQQTLKQHKIYSISKKHSQTPDRKILINRWNKTENQRKLYLDKSAMLAEMSYNHFQTEHSGQKYFEYSLRERWKEELQAPQYIYQIKPGEKFTNSKLISKLKSYRPDIKERQRLLLHGKGLRHAP